jgi:hypothetical protein
MRHLSPQSKLFVGRVDDPSEREADLIAHQIAWVPTATKSDVTRNGPAASGAGDAPASVSEVLARPGDPLYGESRDVASRFHFDFSAVRVHADSAAAASARDLNASAYTAGNAIVFGEGRFDPRSPAGRHLLAHELVHVAQQSGSLAQAQMIRRAPPLPPPAPPPLILGATGPGVETETLYHYGDLTNATAPLNSPKSYPRLTDCDIAKSVEEAAQYTGTPVRNTVRYKYELKIERGFFQKFFKNVGTRGPYSEYATDQPIPVKYFRKVATLLRAPSGGAPPVAGGGATGGGTTGAVISAETPSVAPRPGAVPGTSAEGALAKTVAPEVPAGVVQGVEGGAEGAAAGVAARTVVRAGVRFLGGAAIGVAIGLIAGFVYAALTRKMIENDITTVLKNVPDDRKQRLQARIDALPAGKRQFAHVTLEYDLVRSTLGFLGGPDAYVFASVRLISVHPGNEELLFPNSAEETPGETFPALATRKITVRLGYTVPID